MKHQYTPSTLNDLHIINVHYYIVFIFHQTSNYQPLDPLHMIVYYKHYTIIILCLTIQLIHMTLPPN